MSDVKCAACGRPGHRFGRNEGMDRFDPQACINGLLAELERWAEFPSDADVEAAARAIAKTRNSLDWKWFAPEARAALSAVRAEGQDETDERFWVCWRESRIDPGQICRHERCGWADVIPVSGGEEEK